MSEIQWIIALRFFWIHLTLAASEFKIIFLQSTITEKKVENTTSWYTQ